MTASLLSPGDIRLGERPLIVCDIDEVALEFIAPLRAFLRSTGLDLLPRSFRLHGNVVSLETGIAAEDGIVTARIEEFFSLHDQWQGPVPLAVETLNSLGRTADIVFLTAMPPRHSAKRRALLDRLGLPFPLLAIEGAKGPVVRSLHQNRPQPVVFLDDILHNLQSVALHEPKCLLINLIADRDFLALAPKPETPILSAADWSEAAIFIHAHFSGTQPATHRSSGPAS